jgi:cupin fold WbuC family metalloprotein
MTIPNTPLKRINDDLIDSLGKQSHASHRRRSVYNFHDSSTDPVQRFLNVMQPGTYVRPHRHDNPEKWEFTVVLSGRVAVLLMKSDGFVLERIELDGFGPERGLELPAGIWHTCAALSTNAVLLEIKRGPYDARTDKDFAAWAPSEGTADCAVFERRFRTAQPGDCLSASMPQDNQL